MQNHTESKAQMTPEERQAKRTELADKLGYLLARAWLRRRDAATEPPGQSSAPSTSSTQPRAAPRGR